MPDFNYDGLSDETRRLLEGRETGDVEFKQTAGAITNEDIVAFANAHGGTILAGISKTKEVIGCTEADETIRRVLYDKAAKCRPSVEIQVTEEITCGDKRIYRIDIFESLDKPCCTENGTYKIRQDGHNKGIYPEEMRQIILQRSGLPNKVAQLEHEVEQSRRDSQKLANSIPSDSQIGYIIADKIRGF